MGASNIPVSYTVTNQRSTAFQLAKAFARGCNGQVSYNPHILLSGDFFAFCVKELHPLLKAAIASGRNYYYADHAYFKRKTYYRITKNNTQHSLTGSATPKRFEKLGVTIKQWKQGSKIMICPQSEDYFTLMGKNRADWILETIQEVRKHSDREIVVRYKAGGYTTEDEFAAALSDIWAVIVFTSVAGMQAAVHGVPCFATHDCVSKHFGTNNLALIEKPVKPNNREELAWILADNQWTVDEMKRSIAWEHLQRG